VSSGAVLKPSLSGAHRLEYSLVAASRAQQASLNSPRFWWNDLVQFLDMEGFAEGGFAS
jgi:hypothetical protein